MGGPSKAGQSKKRRWGECLSDYTIGSSSQRAPSKASKKDLEQQKHAKRPDLAPSPDLFEGFITRIFQLPMEDDSTSVPQVEYPDCLSGDIFDDTSEPGSMDEATATRLEESDRALQGMNLTLTTDYVQEVLDHLEKIGPPPTIDSLPKDIRNDILRHDRWYTEIVDNIFEAASKHTHEALDTGLVTRSLFRWISANFHAAARQAIRRILLHPHVRLYRVRAELGRKNWQSLHSRLATNSLELLNKQSPNVFGTYLLHGQRRCGSSELQKNMAYCGKTSAMGVSGDAGVRRRMRTHRDEIQKVRKYLETDTSPPPKKVLWAYQRLAHEDIDKVDYGILSILPFLPSNNLYVVHFHCLLALAEATEVIYLGTQVGRDSPRFSPWWGGEFGLNLRPSGMPPPELEPLNIALPITQPVTFTGLGALNWTPHELIAFSEVFKRHENVYNYHSRSIDWDYVEEELRKAGIDRSSKQIKGLYRQFRENPEFGLESLRSYLCKQHWLQICHLKTFLEDKNLVANPQDEYDNYYHIPELENGVKSFSQFSAFLRHHGFSTEELAKQGVPVYGYWLDNFARVTLPEMLSREIWEHLNSTPPSNLSVRLFRHSTYVRKRFLRVVLYNIYKGVQQNCSSSDDAAMSGFVMGWDFLLEVWHESRAQLLSDGVPPERMPAGGVNDIVYIWDHYKKRIENWTYLSKWTYDLTLDKPRKVSVEALTTLSLGDAQHDSLDDGENSDLTEYEANEEEVSENDAESLSEHQGHQDSSDGYVWPSDEQRLEVLSYSNSLAALSLNQHTSAIPTSPGLTITVGARRQAMMAQHHVSTFRVLVRRMTDMHQAVFAEENATLDHFWEQLFLDMGTDEWGNPSPNTPKGLKERFSWVHEYIIKGKMPVEVLRFMDALRQAWSEDGTVLRITTHPYASKADCAIGSFLNPDLCPRWVNWIMTKNDAMAKVLKWLPERYGAHVTAEKIKHSYGILIPVLWEEAYKKGVLRNGDALDLVSDRISRNNWIETFAELDEAEKDAEPGDAEPEDAEPEDDKTIEAVKELIGASYLSGNASTWAWLHLRFPQQLEKGGNTVLVDAITQLDPDFVRKKEWLMRLKMRKQLGIKKFVNDEEFQFHGRLIPPGLFSTRTSKTSRPLLFKPGEASRPYPLCASTDHPLMKLKDDEECFIFFDKDGINFRARDGKLLHHSPASEFLGRLVELYNHERHLQLQTVTENISSSAASSDMKSGTRKRRAAASEEPITKRVRRSLRQRGQAHPNNGDLDGNQQTPLSVKSPAASRQYWSVEEAEWLYNQVSNGKPVDFHNVAKQMNDLFGIDRSPGSIRTWAIYYLQWKAPKLPPDEWGNNSGQSLWIVWEAKKGTSWKDMVNPFNKKFNSNRTSEELRRRYEEIQRAVNPKTPDAERPDWATSSSESFVLLQASFQGRSQGPRWKKEEDQLLNECRNQKMSWEQTAKKLQRTFGVIRTLGAIKERFEHHHQGQPGYEASFSLRPWRQKEINWLIVEEEKRKEGKTTVADMSTQFEKRFGYPRSVCAINKRIARLREKKLV